MRTSSATLALVIALSLAGAASARSGSPADRSDGPGVVYRYYAGAGYRFQPLLTFANLDNAVSRKDVVGARRLAYALIAHGVGSDGALYWP